MPCACGCGTIIKTPDKQCRERRFVKGHWARVIKIPRPYLEEANERRKIRHAVVGDIEGKPCQKCGRWQPLAEYYHDKRSWDGLSYRCRTCQRKRSLAYYYEHETEIKENRNTEEYRKQMRSYQNGWAKRKYHEDINYRLKKRLRHALWRALTGLRKGKHIIDLLGCSIDEFKRHLEEQFQEGMNWGNYGRSGWEIDHILPIASFDLTDSEQIAQCFHYSNMQPLWGPENWAKSNKMPVI